MDEKNYKALLKALKEQRKKITSSKEAAKKFLEDRGVSHLFVPKKQKKSSSVKTG